MDARTSGLREAVAAAEARVRSHVRETPLEPSPVLGELAGREVHLKMENLQHTGSFKVRGAMNKLLSLSPEERGRGVVAASSGNHGAAVAFGAKKLGLRCRVFVPEGASPTKVRAMQRLDAEILFFSHDAALAEAEARRVAEERGAVYVSPYNDPDVVAGQGTIAAEILRQSEGVGEIFVPVGGGGMISGIAGYLKAFDPNVRVVGCQPARSAVMAHSVRAGHILEMESDPTLSDGTAGGVEPGAATFDLCRALVDDWTLVSEKEIADAMRLVMEAHHTMIEGAAAVGVAALLKGAGKSGSSNKNAVVVLCGANIALETLGTVLKR